MLIGIAWTHFFLTFALAVPAASTSSLKLREVVLSVNPLKWQMSQQDGEWHFEHRIIPQLGASVVEMNADKSRRDRRLRQWIKDYSEWGFAVLGKKPAQVNRIAADVIDIAHIRSGIEMRQVIFWLKETRVLISCFGQKELIRQNFNECNEVAEGLRSL